MDLQSFSQTYWYVWFLISLLIVILCFLNGLGFYLYRKKRRNFLHLNDEESRNIPMSPTSSVSTIDPYPNKYYPMASPSTTSQNFHVAFVSSQSPMKVEKRTPSINPSIKVKSSKSTFSLNTTFEKSEMDLGLEEFQRQALAEHNTMRAMYKKPPVKLSEALNLYAQYWAERCAKANALIPSRPEWRSNCKGDSTGENLISVPAQNNEFDGHYFTALLMAKGNHSVEVDRVLNELTTEVGFGRALMKETNSSKGQWIGVAHYYPYRQLPIVQS